VIPNIQIHFGAAANSAILDPIKMPKTLPVEPNKESKMAVPNLSIGHEVLTQLTEIINTQKRYTALLHGYIVQSTNLPSAW
jgi:hypothetical protein